MRKWHCPQCKNKADVNNVIFTRKYTSEALVLHILFCSNCRLIAISQLEAKKEIRLWKKRNKKYFQHGITLTILYKECLSQLEEFTHGYVERAGYRRIRSFLKK